MFTRTATPLLKSCLKFGAGASAFAFTYSTYSTFARSEQASKVGLSKDFSSLKCVGNDFHTHDTRKITLKLADDDAVWTEAGPIANVVVRVGGAGKATSCCACCKCGDSCGCSITSSGCCSCCSCSGSCGCPKKEAAGSATVKRNYNPINANQKGSLTLLVKRYGENAQMGSALHGLKVGESVDVMGPNQQWGFTPGRYSEYGMIAGGTGITPIIQATRHILAHDSAKVTLVTFNKTPCDILLAADIENLRQRSNGRLKVHHFVGTGAGNNISGRERKLFARSDEIEVQEGKPCPELLQSLLPPPGEGVMVMSCGRKEMTTAIMGPKAPDWTQGEVGGMLADMGYSKENVWKV